jgi:hypothetical protein
MPEAAHLKRKSGGKRWGKAVRRQRNASVTQLLLSFGGEVSRSDGGEREPSAGEHRRCSILRNPQRNWGAIGARGVNPASGFNACAHWDSTCGLPTTSVQSRPQTLQARSNLQQFSQDNLSPPTCLLRHSRWGY